MEELVISNPIEIGTSHSDDRFWHPNQIRFCIALLVFLYFFTICHGL